jgi:crotonobetainyl-CoA:carnitine CoA-transferase CaiB-like acyl-CoA transferase
MLQLIVHRRSQRDIAGRHGVVRRDLGLAREPSDELPVQRQAAPAARHARPNIVPYEAFRAKDDWMILAVGNDGQFKKFCDVAGAPELAQNRRFATNAARVRNRAALTPRVAELIAARPLDWWLGTLDAAGVPCGPINTLDRAFADPQAVQRGLKIELPHAAGGTASGAACPIRLSRTPPRYELEASKKLAFSGPV